MFGELKPRQRRGARRWALGCIAAVSALLPPPVGWADTAGEKVRLEIVNAGAGQPMRCILVLAHFVTLEAGLVEPGESLRLTLEREAADGVLSVRGEDGRRMAVENLLCGVSGSWSETRSDVPLSTLRDSALGELRATCVLAGRLRCLPSTP